MTPTLAERQVALEAQLTEHTQRRDEAAVALQQSQAAILQLQGALSLLRDLIATNGSEPPTGESANEPTT